MFTPIISPRSRRIVEKMRRGDVIDSLMNDARRRKADGRKLKDFKENRLATEETESSTGMSLFSVGSSPRNHA